MVGRGVRAPGAVKVANIGRRVRGACHVGNLGKGGGAVGDSPWCPSEGVQGTVDGDKGLQRWQEFDQRREL